jgi:hypothetical protein
MMQQSDSQEPESRRGNPNLPVKSAATIAEFQRKLPPGSQILDAEVPAIAPVTHVQARSTNDIITIQPMVRRMYR